MELKKQEQYALYRIEESLEEWSGQRYAQHVLSEDLQLLVKMVKGADKVEEIKQAYSEEVSAVGVVVEALEETLKSDGTEFEIITDEGQPTESRKWISREEHLEFMIEFAINELSGKVGYLFMDEKNAKK